MDGVTLTALRQIYHPKGDIFHAMKCSDNGFDGFGEAYFSTINKDDIKGWKKHNLMTLNLIVPIGEIEFVIYNEDTEEFFEAKLSQSNYQRLTVSPGLWMAFKGHCDNNVLLNIASLEHDPAESITKKLELIKYDW